MKRRNYWLAVVAISLMCAALMAQAPQGGARGAGGPGGGGGRGGGRGAAPPATGPVADATNRIVEAINKQDSATLEKALTADAILADED